MKILHTVEFYNPSVGGMQEVVRQLSERLVRLGHEVTVATTKLPDRRSAMINGVRIAEFAVSGNMAGGIKGDADSYRQFLLNSDFDIVTNFAAQQWATDLILPLLGKIKAKKVFVPTGFSGLYSPRFAGYFEQMPNWLDAYDANVFLSEDYRDINFARKHAIRNLYLIPNGAAYDEFGPQSDLNVRGRLGIPDNHFLILHVGSHTGAKGHTEAIRIFSRANIENVTLAIVGNVLGFGGCQRRCRWEKLKANYHPCNYRNNKKVVLLDLSREETVAAYQQADLFLFPSNIECSPIVLFECMASRTPFLVTDVGNAAEIITWSGSGELLPTIPKAEGYVKADVAASVPQLEALYRDKERRAWMADQGYQKWLNHFTWEVITAKYEMLYRGLLEGKDVSLLSIR